MNQPQTPSKPQMIKKWLKRLAKFVGVLMTLVVMLLGGWWWLQPKLNDGPPNVQEEYVASEDYQSTGDQATVILRDVAAQLRWPSVSIAVVGEHKEAAMRPLAIVVPYRDRQEHLDRFLPHMTHYFSRDKIDKDIPYKIVIVEQLGEDPFNCGLLMNIGFQQVRESCDYVCLHHIDYLPIWADYRYPVHGVVAFGEVAFHQVT